MWVVDTALVDRIVEVETENLVRRLSPYAAREGNPSGVHIRRFGGATAFVARAIPVRFFNSVLGTSAETEAHLFDILTFYRSHGVSPAFEIVPGRLPESLGLELLRRGWGMVEFHAGLALDLTEPPPAAALNSDVTVNEGDPSDAAWFEHFLDVYLEGWSGTGDHEEAKANMRGWCHNRDWRFYLAEHRGEPAGSGILDVHGSTAFLGSASTLERKRGCGVQRSLIDRRVADARTAGCDLVAGGCVLRYAQHAQSAARRARYGVHAWDLDRDPPRLKDAGLCFPRTTAPRSASISVLG